MSTFCGLFKEIAGISVDRFTENNYKSKLFFLSHFHTDHMYGLNIFLNCDLVSDAVIYSSEVTTKILKEQHPGSKERFHSLPIEVATCMNISENNSVTVTLIRAGHCPGSVMFLFETDITTVLYTADFRVNADDLGKYKCFYNESGGLKKFNTMYLDTTLFSKSYEKLPTRHESCNAVITLIREWIGSNKKCVVCIDTTAHYGSEYLFVEIWKKLKMPIHVTDKQYAVYRSFPGLDRAITRNGEITQIHTACQGKSNCCILEPRYLRRIKPCVFSVWKDWDVDMDVFKEDKYMYKVCYSCHPSYEETVAFINFFKPQAIEPNVVNYYDEDEVSELRELLNECIAAYQ